jgi:hypothetical protein
VPAPPGQTGLVRNYEFRVPFSSGARGTSLFAD